MKKILNFLGIKPQVEIVCATSNKVQFCVNPVVPSIQSLPSWFKESARKLKEEREDLERKHNATALHRCPGIVSLYKKGFIIPCPHDIVFQFREDKIRCIPSDACVVMQLPTYQGNTRYEFPHTIKIPTDWIMVSNVDTEVLFLPVPYSENSRFRAQTGIFDTSLTQQINVQLLVDSTEKELIIKQGTPLAYCIPLEKNYKLTVKEVSPDVMERSELASSLVSLKTRATLNYSELKKMNKVFRQKSKVFEAIKNNK